MAVPGSSGCFEGIILTILGLLGGLGLLGLLGIDSSVTDPPIAPPPVVVTAVPFVSPTPFPTPTIIPTQIPASSIQPAVWGANSGRIEVGGGEIWEYQGQVGEVLTVEVRADEPANNASTSERIEQGLLDTYVILYDPNGIEILQADDIESGIQTDTQISEVELPISGVYRFEVRSWGDNTGGNYTLFIKSSLEGE